MGRFDSGRYRSNVSKEQSKSISNGEPGEFVRFGVGIWHSIFSVVGSWSLEPCFPPDMWLSWLAWKGNAGVSGVTRPSLKTVGKHGSDWDTSLWPSAVAGCSAERGSGDGLEQGAEH